MWSTVVDAPVSKAMDRQEFTYWYHISGQDPLSERLARAEKYGTSAMDPPLSAIDLISGNRAGPKETELSFCDLLKLVGAI